MSERLLNLLIVGFFVIGLLGFFLMFGMGLYYMEHTSEYGIVGIVSIASTTISFLLYTLKKED